MYIALKLPGTLVCLVLNCPKMGMSVLSLRVQHSEALLVRETGCSRKRILSIVFEELFVSRKCVEVPYRMTSLKSVFVIVSYIYSVIHKDGLNFVSLYFRIRTSDKYDVNYISLYSQLRS